MVDLPRFPLLHGPTPLHPLSRLGAQLGLDLWIKRDDLTGFAGGGSKARKLEYLIPEALASGATCVVASGAKQSNFVRQTAAAAKLAGLRFAAAVMELPYEEAGGRPDWEPTAAGGNVFLDALFEGQLYVYPDGTWDELKEKSKELAQMLIENGEKVHIMPVGGSTPTSVYGLIKGVEEIDRGFDTVVVASSSGSTHAGLAYAYHGTDTNVIGIAADPYEELANEIVELCSGLDELLGQDNGVTKCEIDYRTEWIGDGYSVPSEEGEAAARLMARTEGIILDPVYTSKAFAGLLALADRGELSGRVLFWHTGGTPAVFGHR